MVQAIGPINNILFTPEQQSNPLYDSFTPTREPLPDIPDIVPQALDSRNQLGLESGESFDNPCYDAREPIYSSIPDLRAETSDYEHVRYNADTDGVNLNPETIVPDSTI